jgi:hypothetical protein
MTETELRKAVREADAAWEAARGTGSDLLPALAAASTRLHGELRLLRSGITRKALPAGAHECNRCGGFGGSSQWPGWVCFDCEGAGWTA